MPLMATDFILERGDLNFHANYTEPLFALWKDTDALFQRLYSGLSKHGPAKDFTRMLTSGPQELGTQTGAGAVFYYGPEDGRVSSAVTADLSAVIADGLFFRTLVVWDASQVALAGLRARMNGYMDRVFAGFGLNLTAIPN
jgi:hypothetical protein